jgi:hypothetical protein
MFNLCGFLIFMAGAVLVLLPFPEWFVGWLRCESKAHKPPSAVCPCITGYFERALFFTLAFIGLGSGALATVAVGWIAGKLAANWQRRPMTEDDEEGNRQIRANTLIALMGGVLSVMLAILAGKLVWCALMH